MPDRRAAVQRAIADAASAALAGDLTPDEAISRGIAAAAIAALGENVPVPVNATPARAAPCGSYSLS